MGEKICPGLCAQRCEHKHIQSSEEETRREAVNMDWQSVPDSRENIPTSSSISLRPHFSYEAPSAAYCWSVETTQSAPQPQESQLGAQARPGIDHRYCACDVLPHPRRCATRSPATDQMGCLPTSPTVQPPRFRLSSGRVQARRTLQQF